MFPDNITDINADLREDGIFNSSTSSALTESALTTILTPTVFIPTTQNTATPNPATTTPAVHQSPNSPEDTKFRTKTPTQSPLIVGKMVHKNEEDEQNVTESTNCTFDPCVDLQDTCFNRPDPTCICPGVTSDSQPPDRPTSLSVTVVTHSVVLVKWCAPYSAVLEYLLVVRHEGLAQKNLSISSAVRQVFISDLMADHIYHICVQAVNGAGSSSPKCVSVWMGLNTEVYLYSLLAVCGVLMVIVAALSFCLYKQCKKTPVENPHLTRLISISNPAFFNP